MSDQMGETRSFAFPTDTPDSAKEVIQYVYEALKAKGLEFVTVDSLIYYKDFYIDHAGKQILNAPVS